MQLLKSWISQRLKISINDDNLIEMIKKALKDPEQTLKELTRVQKIHWWQIVRLKGHNLPLFYRNLQNPSILQGEKWQKYLEATKKFINKYAENKKGFILAYSGRYGTGKTLMSAYAIAWADYKKVPSYYIRFTDLVRSFWGKFDELSEDEFKKVYDLLVIDEFQELNVEREEYRRTMEIIKSRFDNGKSTIIITNDYVDDVTTILQPQVIDRLNACGAFFVFDWQSFRDVQTSKKAKNQTERR